jgi:hypothetical protein
MNLLPLTRSTYGLSMREDALCLVEVGAGWRGKPLKRTIRIPLPPGLLKLSSAKPNILQPTEFQNFLQEVAHKLKTPASVALSLPDLCARTTIFEFSQFPSKSKEQTALVQWRFQQDLKLDTSGSRIDYSVYVPVLQSEPSTLVNPDHVRVLGAALRTDIVEQFEQACLEVGLLPVSVGIAGLDIFDLYQQTLLEALTGDSRETGHSHAGGMFLYLSQWGFTFLAFRDRCPQFIRTKAITIRPDSPEPTASGGIDPDPSSAFPSGTSYPFYVHEKVSKEILATIQFYLESLSSAATPSSGIPLFVFTDLEQGMTLLPSAEHIQQTMKASGHGDTLVQIIRLSPMTPLPPGKGQSVSESEAGSALPAFARLKVA